MLKPRALSQLLGQANTGGVLSTMLLNSEGSLLAYSGVDGEDRDAKVTAAIASNIWSAYERAGENAFQNESLNFLVIDCEDGRVAVSRVANQILCIYANKSVGCGILKAKTDVLIKVLEEPLTQVSISSS
ncbi:ragulator complex protein LAMTOR2-like [Corticium candelabrum]|uniref:ragulator complex protein LAMTOR2-like n=1 Tax=Corticium candelabrum TaxID=121492 RepID=UPI002E382308|nr:ragulator complex protein LAMTOR2-like [Corticium candelabrum]